MGYSDEDAERKCGELKSHLKYLLPEAVDFYKKHLIQ
jgi:hypothetical protein